MARARLYYRFRVRDLFVDGALLGRSVEGEVDGKPVAIRVPADRSIFAPELSRPAAGTEGPSASDERTVGTVQVSIDSALPFGADDPSVVDLASDYRWAIALNDEFATNLVLATRVVSGLVEWSRVALDQFGLALTVDEPALLDVQRVFDLDADRFYPLGMHAPGWASFRPGNALPVTEAFVREVLATGYQEHPHAALGLLADARHLAARPQQDWQRAVLAAAIATEVRVKQALRAAANDDLRPLVDFALDNPRDVSVAAPNLFDKAMHAVCGRSLRDEDRRLFKEVDLLFRVRNGVAHHAHRPEAGEGQRAVKAAVDAFVWLDSLPGSERWTNLGVEPVRPAGAIVSQPPRPQSRK